MIMNCQSTQATMNVGLNDRYTGAQKYSTE